RRHADRTTRALELGGTHGLVETRFVLDVAIGRLETQGQQLRGVVTLDGVDVGIAAGLVLEGPAEADVLRVVEPVAVVQPSLDALGSGALRFERTLGEEPRAAQRCL